MLQEFSRMTTDTVEGFPAASGRVTLGKTLSIQEVTSVARCHTPVVIPEDEQLLNRVSAAATFIQGLAQEGVPVYGVTSGFGGRANVAIPPEDTAELQRNMMWFHKTGAGEPLPQADIRAAMLLQANSLMQGVSGIRLEIIRRIVAFLNAGVTPLVPELGSIGASGDLVPLTYISGSVIGIDPCFEVEYEGERMPATAALERLRLAPLQLEAKEGLAMINGTAVMTGTAVNCVDRMHSLLALCLGAQALTFQAMRATNQSFHPFIHRHKPHPGQYRVAQQFLHLMEGSQMSRDELDGRHDYRGADPIQDRYSMRCSPQYLGPIVEGLWQITEQVETEANSVTDNPLIDMQNRVTYHNGNFLGEYIGVAMDQLRHYIGLVAKQTDAQIALMVAPAFNYGLPASLIGNNDRPVNMGLKGLQIAANSIVPLLLFYGNPIADRYLTHAEQFNQNINSQGFNSANLGRQALQTFRDYVAMALLFGIQAADLRSYEMVGHYDARQLLSPATARLYEAVYELVGCTPSSERPYIWNDNEQALDLHIARLSADIASGDQLLSTMATVRSALATRHE